MKPLKIYNRGAPLCAGRKILRYGEIFLRRHDLQDQGTINQIAHDRERGSASSPMEGQKPKRGRSQGRGARHERSAAQRALILDGCSSGGYDGHNHLQRGALYIAYWANCPRSAGSSNCLAEIDLIDSETKATKATKGLLIWRSYRISSIKIRPLATLRHRALDTSGCWGDVSKGDPSIEVLADPGALSL